MTDDRKRNPEEPGTGKPEDAEEPAAEAEEIEEPESVHLGIEDRKGRRITPWAWVPSLYFAEGIPYIIAMTLSVIMYKNLGISNKAIGFWTSILYLPWVIKPLWGPLVDKYWTKRNWVIWMQLFLAICFGGVAFGVQLPSFFLVTLMFLWGIAFLSATHDIAADGTYMLGLSEHQQAWYVGIRSTFYRLAMIAGTGLLPIAAGIVQEHTGLEPLYVAAVGTPTPEMMKQAKSAGAGLSQSRIVFGTDLLEIKPGESKSVGISLSAQPKSGETKTVYVSWNGSSKVDVEKTSFVFTEQNWNTAQSATITASSTVKKGLTGQFAASFRELPRSTLGRFWSSLTSILRSKDQSKVSIPVIVLSPPLKHPEALHLVKDENVLKVPAGKKNSFYVRLSKAPEKGKQIVVAFSSSGSRDLRITEGDRLVFNQDNWDVPTTVTMSADKRMKEVGATQVRGLAGNIPLSWLVVFAFAAVLFVFFFFYHGTMIPYSKIDRPDTGSRPPFHQPVFWLLLAVAIPSAIGVGMYIGLDQILATSFRKLLIAVSSSSSPVVTKGFNFFFAIARLALIGIIIWILFQFTAVRKPVGATFNYMSDQSEIGFVDVFATFFKKDKIGIMLAFLLLYRLGEAQLVKMASPFLLDSPEKGGLNLSVAQVGIVYGTVGILALTVGGLLGGFLVASGGLKKWLWPMAIAINAPDLVYVYLSKALPTSFTTINICVAIEQFGYGFGFTAYMLYMIYISQGKYKTAHFALTTGFMALGMMIPGMASGFLENILGYHKFFIAVVLFTLPGFLILPFLPIDETFGVKEKKKA